MENKFQWNTEAWLKHVNNTLTKLYSLLKVRELNLELLNKIQKEIALIKSFKIHL